MTKNRETCKEKVSESMPFCFTSMIDIVFLLLIFFLIASTFKQPEQRLDANLPNSGKTPSPTPPPIHELCIFVKDDRLTREHSLDFRSQTTRKASYYFGSRDATSTKNPWDFYEALRIRAANPEQAVLLAPYGEDDKARDQSTPFQNYVTLVDICKKAGIRNIRFQTRASN